MSASPAPLAAVSREVRGRLVELSHRAGTPHLGSSLSCVDILVATYWNVLSIDPKKPTDPNRDRFILSKGHAASAIYTVLAMRGFFPLEWLDHFNEDGGKLPEQPAPGLLPGIEAATGSLGHGLSIGLGAALAARIQNRSYGVYVLVSDGECNEGSIWEAAMFASAQKLNNVRVVVDFNKWQATGRSTEVMSLDPLSKKWDAFGWKAMDVDGHDLDALTAALRQPPDPSGRPLAIIAHTVKGKGVSFMEDDNNWHYRSPNAEEVARARKELGLA